MRRVKDIWARPIPRRIIMLWTVFTLLVGFANLRAIAQSPDPSGTQSGTAANVQNAAGSAFSAEDLASMKGSTQHLTRDEEVKILDTVGQTQLALNITWTLLTGFLVMFMQAGFALVETGFCRAKSAAHVMMTNFMIYPIGMLGFWICGFAFMFGSIAQSKIGGPTSLGGLPSLNGWEFRPGGFGIFGTKGFFLGNSVYDVGVFTMFLFQMVFMDTTATIPTGAMAERWRFSAFIVYGFFISMICYPIYGHMMWGGGGLAMLGQNFQLGHGAVDFAGSSVVHAVGGMVALAGARKLGPRIGKFNPDGTPNSMPGHNIPFALLGTFILAFGWFGFNPGSTLGSVGGGNLRISVIATNTMLASASGALGACLYMKWRYTKFSPSMSANGMLAGLVAITAPCAFVNAWSAITIGLCAGILVCFSIFFWERRGIDDPVGAISVHGVCGLFGLLSVGIFADGKFGDPFNGVKGGVTGLFYGDNKQILAQGIAALVCICWAYGSSSLFFMIQGWVMKLRPTPEDELKGLDLPEMGEEAYPEFVQK